MVESISIILVNRSSSAISTRYLTADVTSFQIMTICCSLVVSPSCGDANGDCLVIGSDVTYLVNYFRGCGLVPLAGDCDSMVNFISSFAEDLINGK